MNNEWSLAIAFARMSDLRTRRTALENVGPTEDIIVVSCTKCETFILSLPSYIDAEMMVKTKAHLQIELLYFIHIYLTARRIYVQYSICSKPSSSRFTGHNAGMDPPSHILSC